MLKCPNCGYESINEFRFCPMCGYKFTNENETAKSLTETPVLQEEIKSDGTNKYFKVVNGLYEYPKAPLGKRLGAYLIDCLILFVLSIPSMVLFVLGYFMSPNSDPFADESGNGGSFIGGILALWGFFLLIVPAIYYFVKDGLKNGQSFGKRFVNLMVVDIQRNKPCKIGKSAFRNLISSLIVAIPFINFLTVWIEPIMVLARNDGKKAADFVASTQVIDAGQFNH